MIKEGESFRFAPGEGVDILKVAQSVGKPTNEMCLRCHLAVGGGPNHKHGVTPTKDADIHVARGLNCVNCHTTKKHRIAGGSDLKAQEMVDVKVQCTNCHKEPVHKGGQADYLNAHTKRIACQTCHIPAIARDPKLPTISARDWTKPVLMPNGLYGPTNTMVSNMKPVYRWWNRLMKIPPYPVGSLADQQSKITPWKVTNYTVIADAETGHAVYIKAGLYSVTGDPGAAAAKGAEDGKQKYSGKWKGEAETMYLSVNHQVAPKNQALTCNACHSEKGVLDFKALGYKDEEIKKLTTQQ